MYYLILAWKGQILIRKSVWAITPEELIQPPVQKRLKKLDASTQNTYGDHVSISPDFELEDLLNSSEEELTVPTEPEGLGTQYHDFNPEKKWMPQES
jgi:hypothetical protein